MTKTESQPSWVFPVYNYTEKRPFAFRIHNIFSGDYLAAFEEFITYYEPDVIVPYPNCYPQLKPRAERICRFCGKKAGEVSFRKDAHLIPECLGNHNLIHDIECDECNLKFSKYETSFADSVGVYRTTDGMKGKRGIPSFKNSGITMYAEKDESGNNVVSIDISDNEKAKVNEEEGAITFSTTKTPYVPLHVMKILFKIGYSVLSDSEIEQYSHLDLIINSDALDDKLRDYCKVLKFAFPKQVGNPFLITFKRRKEVSVNMPTKIVLFYFGRFMYEYILLNSTDDFMIRKGGEGKILYCPPYWNLNDGRPTQQMVDFSSTKRRTDVEAFKFVFDDFRNTAKTTH